MFSMLPLETEPVARDNSKVLTVKPGEQTSTDNRGKVIRAYSSSPAGSTTS